jgi:hypothetical protein
MQSDLSMKFARKSTRNALTHPNRSRSSLMGRDSGESYRGSGEAERLLMLLEHIKIEIRCDARPGRSSYPPTQNRGDVDDPSLSVTLQKSL